MELVAEIEHRVAVRRLLIAQWFSITPHSRTRGCPSAERTSGRSGKPSHKVFVVEDKEVGDEDPTPSGLASGQPGPHKDGKGLNLVLSALPINGRLVLREYTPDDERRTKKKVAKFRK